jgi:uncharacterized ferritin-like protein (DUF455 family)
MNSLFVENVFDKLKWLESSIDSALARRERLTPQYALRDAAVLNPAEIPDRPSITCAEGQARLLHDLASIELQAMELGLRTLIEYPDAPAAFRQELAEVARSESAHLRMCLEEIETLGFRWAQWPVHCALWNCTDREDSLIDRILIVHRYLEGCGLDAGENILRKFQGSVNPRIKKILEQIVREEVGHVAFGSTWYREICRLEKIDPQNDFAERMSRLKHKIPRRNEKISRDLRLRAGFTDSEINHLEEMRKS